LTRNKPRQGSAMRLPRMTTGQWMISVAGSAIVFAYFGVNLGAAMVITAFVGSALIARPVVWHDWLILLIGALSALPWIWLAYIYTFACRAAVFLGRWPYYAHPDPKDLPDRFHQSDFLDIVIPTIVSVILTCVLTLLVRRLVPWPRAVANALVILLALWLFAVAFIAIDPGGVLVWFAD
jgi:hypothetical protein